MGNLRLALRLLFKRPAFSTVVIAMLAIGIGATTAMFSLYHTILLKPLDVPAPERLVNIESPGPKPGFMSTGSAGRGEAVFSYPMFRDLQAGQDQFIDIAAYDTFDVNLSNGSRTLSGLGMLVSGSYFDVLGLKAALGRLIGTGDDDSEGGDPAVTVLSYGLWQSYFGGSGDIIGRTLTVNGQLLTIIGVAPAGFVGTTLGQRTDLFVPLALMGRVMQGGAGLQTNRLGHWLYMFGRLEPGVPRERAEAALTAQLNGILNEVEAPMVADIVPDAVLETFRQRKVVLQPGALGQSVARNEGRAGLTLLLGTTLLVLLIACVNVANLLLARGASRQSEIAIRASVGATRLRLIAQFLTETGVLAVIGALASLPVAALTLRAIVSMIPDEAAAGIAVGLDGTAMSFAALLTLSTVFVFGLVPAWRGARTDPGLVIKGQSPNASGASGLLRFRRLLATAQIALSVVLLVLAGLFAESLGNIARVDLGMRVESLVDFSISPRLNGYDSERVMDLYARIEDELAAEPGVTDVATSMVPILTGSNWNRGLTVEGAGDRTGMDAVAWMNEVGTGYFSTLGIPVLRGRDFTAADNRDAPRVAIVNQAFVDKFGLGDTPIGKRFALNPADSGLDIEIVGLVANARYSEVKDDPPPQYFLPRLQDENIGSLSFYVRAGLEPERIMERIPVVVARVDPNLPVENLRTMERTVGENVFFDRMLTVLSTSFAALAMLLAAVGLYGVLAYNVEQRRRELGLRLALGATPSGLRSLVLLQVGRMALVGIPLGLVVAVLSSRAAESLFFGLSGFNILVLAAAVALIGAVVFVAGLLPALRASSMTPMQALRYE